MLLRSRVGFTRPGLSGRGRLSRSELRLSTHITRCTPARFALTAGRRTKPSPHPTGSPGSVGSSTRPAGRWPKPPPGSRAKSFWTTPAGHPADFLEAHDGESKHCPPYYLVPLGDVGGTFCFDNNLAVGCYAFNSRASFCERAFWWGFSTSSFCVESHITPFKNSSGECDSVPFGVVTVGV